METKDILASIEETKDLIRRVRTPGGARRYGQPIGSIIVPDAPVPGARRKRSKRTASKLPPLDTVNPSSHGVYEGYRPKDRASAPLAENIVTLAETTGSDPDERITIYRGVPKGAQTAITPGDFITTNRQLAKDYAGTGDVISAEVRKGDILDDADEPEGEEYVYRPERRQRDTERVSVAAAQVAPSPEVAEGSGEEVEVDGRPYAPSQTYVTNDPLITSQLDMDFMKNGTAREAHDRLVAMGARVQLGKEFATNRDFMTALSEAVRIFEQEFPGFVARHGDFHSMSTRGNVGGFNTFTRKKKSSDTIADMGSGKEIRDAATNIAVFGGFEQSAVEAMSNNGTTTVFTLSGTNWDQRSLEANIGRRGSGQPHFSMTDAYESLTEAGLTPGQIGSLHVATHELGHAISMSVAGRMSFEIDGKKDPEQEQRRWYREYYANSRLQFLEDLGVAKRTGKEYVADSLIDQAHYQETIQELFGEIQPSTPWPGKEPRRANRNASPEAKARAEERRAKWQAQADAHNQEMKKARDEQAKRFAELIASGKSMPSFSVTPEDGANGYNSESKPLWQFLKGLERAGFLTDVVPPGQMVPLMEMTSEYGSTNWHEIEAETWAAYMLNGNVTKGVSRWGEQMHTMMQWWSDDDAEMEKNR